MDKVARLFGPAPSRYRDHAVALKTSASASATGAASSASGSVSATASATPALPDTGGPPGAMVLGPLAMIVGAGLAVFGLVRRQDVTRKLPWRGPANPAVVSRDSFRML